MTVKELKKILEHVEDHLDVDACLALSNDKLPIGEVLLISSIDQRNGLIQQSLTLKLMEN